MNSRWIFAGVASIALHAVILSVMVGWHLSSERTEGPNAPAVEKPSSAVQPEMSPLTTPAKTPASTLLGSEEDDTGFSAARKPQQVVQSKDTRPAEPQMQKPAAVTPKVEPQAQAPAKGHKIATYVVKSGDSLTSVAKEFDCTPAELAKLNGKPYKAFAKLYVGQKIKVKAKEE